jgi:hypothetical protein
MSPARSRRPATLRQLQATLERLCVQVGELDQKLNHLIQKFRYGNHSTSGSLPHDFAG